MAILAVVLSACVQTDGSGAPQIRTAAGSEGSIGQGDRGGRGSPDRYPVRSELAFPGDAPMAVESDRKVQVFAYRLPIWDPARLAQLARLVVRGQIIDVGGGHFNSDGGEVWEPLAHATADRAVARELWHEVQVEVTEVLGDAAETGLSPGDRVVYVEPGGAFDAVAPDGRVVRYTAPVHAVYENGDDVVVMLDWERRKGLYGGRLAYRYELMPVNVGQYMFHVEDGQALSADVWFYDGEAYPNVDRGALDLPYSELRELVVQHVGTDAGPVPVGGVHDLPPHPPVNEPGVPARPPLDEPPHTHGEDERA